MSESESMDVQCDRHGKRIAAVVCVHLLQAPGGPQGFIENSSDPHDLQAWCQRCEDLFEVEQDLTETFRAFADVRIVCTVCYAEIKERNAS